LFRDSRAASTNIAADKRRSSEKARKRRVPSVVLLKIRVIRGQIPRQLKATRNLAADKGGSPEKAKKRRVPSAVLLKIRVIRGQIPRQLNRSPVSHFSNTTEKAFVRLGDTF